jgi:type I restriction-modification system DNA methylase subunit
MQKVPSSAHNFEQEIRALHDHLYANSNIRESEALHGELARAIAAIADLQSGREGHRVEIDEVRDLISRYQPGGSVALDEESVRFVVERLSAFDLSSDERDFVGDALEVIRGTAAKRLGGQFFTDQRVTRLAVELLDYDPSAHDFLDVCAGTGGFLVAAAGAARNAGVTRPKIAGMEVDGTVASLANRALHISGLSIDVNIQDSLKPLDDWGREGEVLRLASNPPFGMKITVKDARILDEFQLARRWGKAAGDWEASEKVVPRPPDILFIERNLMLAKPGSGRVALVLPYQVLSGPKLGFVRKWLLANANILAVVDLPDDTFQPWTGTKTSLLVFERREQPLDSLEDLGSETIFMAEAGQIGHDRRGNPVFDENGAIITDLPQIGEAWRRYSEGGNPSEIHGDAFTISTDAITLASDRRLNAAYYHPKTTGLRTKLKKAASTYEVKRLGDVVERIWCPGRFKRNYVEGGDGGVPFLGGSNITQFFVTTEKFLHPEDPRLGELVVEPGLILITRSGSTGIVSRVPEAWDGWAISEHVIRVKPKEALLSGDYLEAFLRSQYGKQLLQGGIFGSVIDEITPEYVGDLMIPIPRDGTVLRQVSNAQKRANRGREAAASGILASLAEIDDVFGQDLAA